MGLVKSCCYCCNLAQGAIAVGICTLVLKGISVTTGVVNLVAIHTSQTVETIFVSRKGENISPGETYYWLLLTEAGVGAIFSILLLIGIAISNRKFFIPWLLERSFSLTIVLIYNFYGQITSEPPTMKDVFFVCYNVFMIYCFVVVLSFYSDFKKIQEESKLMAKKMTEYKKPPAKPLIIDKAAIPFLVNPT